MSRGFLGFLRQVAAREAGGLTDRALLEGYVHGRDEAALTALVQRHSAMVWGVCRRLLGDGQDAEDAFQATFLVLVRKAAGLREPEKVANWLYGVAQQTAVRMRALRARQGNRERQVQSLPERGASGFPGRNDLAVVLDEELSRLPEKYRTLIVLCDLEDKTRSEVARQLGCPEGTVAGRLARARALLADRLQRRGVATTASALTAAIAAQATVAPAALLRQTIHSAMTGVLAPNVAFLTDGVVKTMFLNKLKLGAMLGMTLLAFTTGSLLLYTVAQPVPPQPRGTSATDARKPSNPDNSTDMAIKMMVSPPQFRKPEPVLLPNFAYWEVKVQYRNESKDEVVLSPFVTVTVHDAKGKPVPNDVRIGAGFIGEDWMTEIEKEFLILPPGKTREVLVNLGDNRSPGGTIGWKFEKPGTYKVVVAYTHSRKAFATDYLTDRFFFSEEALNNAKRPERLWNRAVEMQREVELQLVVK